MMLRSSSTPVLGSLLQSFSESPNHQSELHKHVPSSVHPKISCCGSGGGGGSGDFRKSLFHPSPSVAGSSPGGGFRRVQSDGNLEGLVDNSYGGDELNLPKRFGRRNSCSNLEAIPSSRNLWTSFENDDDDYEGLFPLPSLSPLPPLSDLCCRTASCCCFSLLFAAGTHVLFTCVWHWNPLLLQHVLHLICEQSFFAWFPQSWQLIPPPPPPPPPLLIIRNPDLGDSSVMLNPPPPLLCFRPPTTASTSVESSTPLKRERGRERKRERE